MWKIMSTSALIETMRALLNDQYDEVHRLKDELKEVQEDLWHRDSILSIMYDLIRSDLTDSYILEIIEAVINVEVWSDLSEKQQELVQRFWNREF